MEVSDVLRCSAKGVTHGIAFPLEWSVIECEKEVQRKSEVSNLFFGSSGVKGSAEKKAFGCIVARSIGA